MQEETEQDALWRVSGELQYNTSIDNLPEAISTLEQSNIVIALEKYKGNRTKAADELGIGRTNLIAKIRKYDIKTSV
jgi:DNA-binding NtrC family response regulator